MPLPHREVRGGEQHRVGAAEHEEPVVVVRLPGELDEAGLADRARPGGGGAVGEQARAGTEVGDPGGVGVELALVHRDDRAAVRGAPLVQQVADGEFGAGLRLVLRLAGELRDPIGGRVGLVGLEAGGEVGLGAGGVAVAEHLGAEGQRDDVAAVEVFAVGDHRHQRLAGVAGHQQHGAPEPFAVRLRGEHLRQRRAGGEEVHRVAAGGAPELLLVVRAERTVVLDEEGVVEVRGGVRADRTAVDEPRVGQVGGGQAGFVAAPGAEGGAPLARPRVGGCPRERGGQRLGVDAHLFELGVADVAATQAVGRPAAGVRVVAGAERGGVGGLPGGDALDVLPGRVVQIRPQETGGEHEVRLEGGVEEQLPAPLGTAGQPVRRGEAPDRGQGVCAEGLPADAGDRGVVAVAGEQHGVAEHDGEGEVPGRVGAGDRVELLLGPARVPQQHTQVGRGDRVGRRSPACCRTARSCPARRSGEAREQARGQRRRRSARPQEAERSPPVQLAHARGLPLLTTLSARILGRLHRGGQARRRIPSGFGQGTQCV